MSQLFKGSVGLVIPTYRAGERWTDILSALVEQDFQLTSALVIDSNSPDHTVLISQTAGLAVRVIDKAAFNHGGTRQYGLSQLGPIDVVVFLTQDAQLATPDSLAALVAPFSDPTVAAQEPDDFGAIIKVLQSAKSEPHEGQPSELSFTSQPFRSPVSGGTLARQT